MSVLWTESSWPVVTQTSSCCGAVTSVCVGDIRTVNMGANKHI